MTFWDWFRWSCLSSVFFWWVVLIVVVAAGYPLAVRFRAWQARRRFIESQGRQLENPDNAEARFQLAHLYAEGKSWRRAARYAEDAVRAAKSNPLYDGRVPYHFLRLCGEALLRLGRYPEAEDAFVQALKAKSELGHAEARFGLGKVLYRRGKVAEALDCFREVVRDHASNLEAYFRQAQAAAALGKDDEARAARAEFRKVAASLPRFARQKRLRWRLAFLLFPLTRHLA